jgi:hypothetical protein
MRVKRNSGHQIFADPVSLSKGILGEGEGQYGEI